MEDDLVASLKLELADKNRLIARLNREIERLKKEDEATLQQ